MKRMTSRPLMLRTASCLIAATVLLQAAPSIAQQTDANENFKAFREKLAAERVQQALSEAEKTAPATAGVPAAVGAPTPAIVSPSTATPPVTMPVMPTATVPAATTTVTTTTTSPASPAVSPVATPSIAPGIASPVSPLGNVVSPVASPLGAAGNIPSAASPLGNASNPLGPAANLPLNGQLTGGPQSQAEIQAALEAETAVLQKKADDQVFDSAVKQLMPMRPDEVRKLLGLFQENREAAETPYSTPEPKQIVTTVSLDPSEAPPIVKMSPGNVTTVTILDSTGAPWPIQDISWAGKFDVTAPEPGGHILRITPQSAHGVGNISIRLVDLIAPITMTLQTGLQEVYYRFDARIPKAGPLAKTPLIEYGGLKSVAGKDSAISSLLDGTPPSGARRLKVNGTDGRTTAYKIDDKVYLRTPLTLLSPGWDSSATSADGINVYTIPQAPVILLSDQGRMVQTRLAEEGAKP